MGRDRKNEARSEHFASMTRRMMETPAWRALSTTAQALYPWLKLEWHGPKFNNNGKIRLSVRQAEARIGVSRNTAARAFLDLQAKGFIVVTERAHLGLSGKGTGHAFELTEIPLPASQSREGRRPYLEWKEGHDFEVIKAQVHNSRVVPKKQDPGVNIDRRRRKNSAA